ncbi:MAG: PEP-CTERM sorting domain-containing protein [Candidatus Korobacteraceae bacterium]
MNRPGFLFVFLCLLALTTIPSSLHADQFCYSDPAPYQYQSCGTFAPRNVFDVNSTGLSGGVYGVFEGYHADFTDSVIAQVVRNQIVVYTGYESPSNKELQAGDTIPLIPAGVLQAGDQVNFVLNARDVNGEQLYDSYYLFSNIDKNNHTWAEQLPQNECAPGQQGSCLFVGFEDEYCISGGLCEWGNSKSEPDYNDFKMWVYGLDLQQNVSTVPEPSSLLLMTGAPLVFAFRKLRNLF